MLALAWLLACAADPVDLVLDVEHADECEPVCAAVTGPPGAEVTASGGPAGETITTSLDASGAAELCWTPPLRPGVHAVVARVHGAAEAGARLEVHPFGWHLGLDKPTAALDEPSWIPTVGELDAPVLEPDPEGWDSLHVMAATTLWHDGERLLYYGGTADEDFGLGLATRSHDGAPFTRHPQAPLLSDPDVAWKRYAQSNPEVEAVGEEIWLWYTGRAQEEGELAIGLATSADGVHFVDHPDNPVLSGTLVAEDFDRQGVAHPSVVQRDGLYELWYASGTLAMGYALSEDGAHWERSCRNPVWTGGAGPWDAGEVKAPEVHFDGDRYWMAWSGGGKGSYQVGWAESLDGLRWVAHPDPLIPRQGVGWASDATQEAYLEVDRDGWWLWFSGNDGEHQRIGVAFAPHP